MHTKTTFYAALLLKLLKLYPPTRVSILGSLSVGFFAKSYSHFKHMILNILSAL
jgi:hypothetical protein